MNIDEDKITKGMDEFAKFKALAQEAVAKAQKAQDEANYFKGQQQLLMQQKKLDDDRHQHDLQRIVELEAVITGMLETFALAEAKVRSRRTVSTNATETELDEGIRRLATASIDNNPGLRGVFKKERG